MSRSRLRSLALLALPAALLAQGRPDPAALLAAQREAMARLAFMDGTWRGTARTVLPSGESHSFVQTERVGPFLDGAVKVVEGRGYDAQGKLVFNAFGTIHFNPATRAFRIQSHAMGQSGEFPLTPKADGFVWESPAGPMTIRYTATIKGGSWEEVGERIAPGQAPVRFHEMKLTRIGDCNWPAAGAVGPK